MNEPREEPTSEEIEEALLIAEQLELSWPQWGFDEDTRKAILHLAAAYRSSQARIHQLENSCLHGELQAKAEKERDSLAEKLLETEVDLREAIAATSIAEKELDSASEERDALAGRLLKADRMAEAVEVLQDPDGNLPIPYGPELDELQKALEEYRKS